MDLDASQREDGVWEVDEPLGLRPDMTNAEYHASRGVSKSHLDDISPEQGMTPLHYWDKRVNPEPPPPKAREDHFIVGDAGHAAILEPDSMSRFAFVPEDAPDRPTEAMKKSKNPSMSSQDRVSWWADFEREHEGKTILPVKFHQAVIGMRDAVHMHPVAKHLFTAGRSEQTFFARDPETAALIKCRFDYEQFEQYGRAVDLKTTLDASESGFRSAIFGYRYDVQHAWYKHVAHSAYPDAGEFVRSFVFVAIEKVRPFALGVYWLEPEDVINGMELARRDLNTILECRETGLWPDFGCTPRQLRINRRKIAQ